MRNWDAWKKEIVVDLVYGFAVITVPVFGEFLNIGIKQLPLILTEYHYKKWLMKDAHLSEITSLLEPLDEKYLNAYPISNEILINIPIERRFINPIGGMVIKERHGHKKSMGSDDSPDWDERLRGWKCPSSW